MDIEIVLVFMKLYSPPILGAQLAYLSILKRPWFTILLSCNIIR